MNNNEKNNSSNIGIINEIGDLGFGFTEITEEEEKTIEKSKEKNIEE